MSSTFLVVSFLLVALLAVLLVWALRSPRKSPGAGRAQDDLGPLGALELNECHAGTLRQVQQALDPEDMHYLAKRLPASVVRGVRRQRRRVVLTYLQALRSDFQKLLQLARIIAALSPEIETTREFERVWLQLTFLLRFELIRLRLHLHMGASLPLEQLGYQVSTLALRTEQAIRVLGERAAEVGELASVLDRRGMKAT